MVVLVIGVVTVSTVISSVTNESKRAHRGLRLHVPIMGQLGVMIPCVLTLYCPLMYCILGWVVGEGLLEGRLIYSFHTVCM